MSAALLDLLTARATGQQNGPVLEMLAKLRAGEPLPRAPELLAQLGNTNPMFGLLAQQLMQSTVSRPRPAIDVEPLEARDAPDTNAAREPAAPVLDDGAAILELRERITILTGEAQNLGSRLGQLAEALGACGLCWGEDRECRACRGRGRPGYAVPNESLFEELVLPAVRVLRAQRLPRATVTPLRATDSTPSALNAT
jgi:hypothetical protein